MLKSIWGFKNKTSTRKLLKTELMVLVFLYYNFNKINKIVIKTVSVIKRFIYNTVVKRDNKYMFYEN